jgi:poly-beta-1,6-N-acetyl-D-glucosamine synthase
MGHVQPRPQSGLTDPVTKLGTRAKLLADLGAMAERRCDGTHMLATFELTGLDRYERERGPQESVELVRRLARRLTDAVAGAGVPYRIGHARWAVLARVGRGGARTIMLACAAALGDCNGGPAVLGRSMTMLSKADLVDPAEALPGLTRAGAAAAASFATEPARRRAGSVRRTRPARALQNGRRASGTPQAAGVATATLPRVAGAASGVAARGSGSSGRSRRTDADGPEGGIGIEVASGLGSEPGSPTIDVARGQVPPSGNPPPKWLPYMRVSTRFKLSMLVGVLWMGFSAWLASPWIAQLATSITLAGAIFLITGLALIPGYLNMQLVASLLLDHPKRIDPEFAFAYPELTVLVAAYNEQQTIAQTLAYTLVQDYPGGMSVIVIDDGSPDETANIAQSFARLDDRVRVLRVPHGGKAAALNAGLGTVSTPLVATIDADTLLMPGALRRIAARMLLAPSNTVAVAGSVMVRNSRGGIAAAAQTWDYFLGIGSIKRQQALLQSTLVAQGAFSVYDTVALRAVNGWPDCIGEDIVMTWALLDQGGATTYEPSAVAFTEAPVTFRQLARQRRRWARGMIEGLREYGIALVRQRRAFVHGIIADAMFPYLDFVFTFAFIPGIVLALTGNFVIVGPMTLAVLPLNAVLASVMYHFQRSSLREAGLRIRNAHAGLAFFFLLYQMFMSPVSVSGYIQEGFHASRRW